MDAGYALTRIANARRGGRLALLEGVHALKHALRFDAEVSLALTPDRDALLALVAKLAPDLTGRVDALAVEVDADTWGRAVPRPLPSPVVAVAPRRVWSAEQVLATGGVVVVLEEPRHLGNLGAVVRVAAAADIGGVLVLGDADPWAPTAVRGAAGLQFALPVARTDVLPVTDRPLVALDGGSQGTFDPLDPASVLLVGTERGGLSPALRARAARTMRIPMRPEVSSLNLATAVAVALYRQRSP